MRWRICLALVLAFAGTAGARPPARIPARETQILEQLPRGYAALMPAGKAADTPPADRALALLATAARSGDSRLARRAVVVLDALPPDDARPDVLRARAFAAQYDHDFDSALALLDRLVAHDPRDPAPRMARAQIHLVRGEIARAQSECGALALGVDAVTGLACVAAVKLRTGDFASALRLAGRWHADAEASDPGMRRYVAMLQAESAMRAGHADADRLHRQALALDPDDVRTRVAYARFLLGSGRGAEVRALLADAGDSDTIALQRALAAAAAGESDAPAQADAPDRRYRQARALGSPAELRDEAQFRLVLRGDVAGALALARENFAGQRDFEDVALLQRAARAAGDDDALASLAAWAGTAGVPLEDRP